ncbi:hypothetical protein D1872_51400 [compost metagenome]
MEIKVTITTPSPNPLQAVESGIMVAQAGYKYVQQYQGFLFITDTNVVMSDEAYKALLNLISWYLIDQELPDWIQVDSERNTVTNTLTGLQYNYVPYYTLVE